MSIRYFKEVQKEDLRIGDEILIKDTEMVSPFNPTFRIVNFEKTMSLDESGHHETVCEKSIVVKSIEEKYLLTDEWKEIGSD